MQLWNTSMSEKGLTNCRQKESDGLTFHNTGWHHADLQRYVGLYSKCQSPAVFSCHSSNLCCKHPLRKEFLAVLNWLCAAACSRWNFVPSRLKCHNDLSFFLLQHQMACQSIPKYFATEPIQCFHTWPEGMFNYLIIPQAQHVWNHLLVIYSALVI